MLIIWSVWDVRREQKTAFSRSQESWKALKFIDGFQGRIGGWNVNRPWEACTLGFWRDFEACQNFMWNYHDRIFYDQGEAYETVQLSYTIKVDEILGAHGTNFSRGLTQAKRLRVGDFITKIGSEFDVMKEQQAVWNPALHQSAGMLGGVFSQERGRNNRFIITSLWEDASSLQRFRDEQVVSLRERLDYQKDIDRFITRTIRLHDSWRILP
ncbi:DUF4937 domain-containing protein [Marininema halotolerans]|uniref:DUF4937 domain-containing protein n=1 Tax=Marininema halotolerans TaxID=1155944 RepID=A0A1I6R4F0_9BACL|nr:DUF4937 domain-containing protein [Marininema halotolerans]SFS59430.1 protein of unknown function [Marininema halotolerans]